MVILLLLKVMPSKWYIVPEKGSGSIKDPIHPKYSAEFEDYSSYQLPDGNRFLVRYYGTSNAHSSTSSNDDAKQIPDDKASEKLNNVLNRSYSQKEWENMFDVGAKDV